MVLFLIVVGMIGLILHGTIEVAFSSNPFLNSVIIGTLLIGVFNAFRQVVQLYPEITWVDTVRIADPGLVPPQQPVLLAPMANMLRDRRGVLSLTPASMRSIIDSVGSRLDERRDTSRYLVNLLIFLGLLGTFFGLLETLQSVGKTINSLDVGSGNAVDVFQDLKTGLQAPLTGMGTAFSASLFGLSGSLILGFLDLQTSQAQGRFYNEFEEWLSALTELTPTGESGETAAAVARSMAAMRSSLNELGVQIQQSTTGSQADAVKELAEGIEKLVRQMRAEQKVVREWMDEQASQQGELISVLRELPNRMTPPAPPSYPPGLPPLPPGRS
jgi:hypothetical protein